MENWRKDLNKKMNTKAFIRGDLNAYFDDLPMIEDEKLTLERVLEELIFHWEGRLMSTSWVGYYDISNYEKRQYKKVCNNFLKKYGDKNLVPDYCLDSQRVKIVNGKVKLV
ncbi:MAG: hypothetical protein ACOCV1_03455 [Bacillota bacterium]